MIKGLTNLIYSTCKGWGTCIFKLFYMQLTSGPHQANLVLIAYASSEGSGEPAHPRSLARTSAARSYKQWVKRNLQTESQIPGPSEWLGMRSLNLSECSKTQIRLTGLKCRYKILVQKYCIYFDFTFTSFQVDSPILWSCTGRCWNIWAPSSENVSSGVCDQITFKPACSATETS